MHKFKEKWGVGIWAGRDNLADMHIILTRQGALTARSFRRLAPSEATDQQLLLAAKGHLGRLKALADEPGLPLLSAQSSTSIRPPEPAAAQDTAAEPAPTTTTGGETEQSEEKVKSGHPDGRR